MSEITFPVLNVQMIALENIQANDYNPNKVATPELRLLELSIKEDGYTQPIVCYYAKELKKYVIVDGFHRYYLAKEKFKLEKIPVTVIDKEIGERMASTIRHNRARGKHSVQGMVNLIEEFISLGWTEEDIGQALGMEREEVIRLRQATGLKQLFSNHEFSQSWNEFEQKYYR